MKDFVDQRLKAQGIARGEDLLAHPGMRQWRDLADRRNCVVDLGTGLPRVHLKVLKPGHAAEADAELRGLTLLVEAGVPCPRGLGWGALADGGAWVATEDLAGMVAADHFIERGGAFSELLEPTARLAARLHDAGLHHCDLYLNHFFVASNLGDSSRLPIRLIDAARVSKLGWLRARRWVIKDLAQFLYSAQRLRVPQALADRWLKCYMDSRVTQRGLWLSAGIPGAIRLKRALIARHDRQLNRTEPRRHRPLVEVLGESPAKGSK